MAQLVKRLTPDSSSGHDLSVHEMGPHVGLCADNMKLAWVLSLSRSLKINKLKTKLVFYLESTKKICVLNAVTAFLNSQEKTQNT